MVWLFGRVGFGWLVAGALAGGVARAQVAVDCSVDRDSVIAGQVVAVSARGTSSDGRPLRYSFVTSSGRISDVRQGGAVGTAALATAGLGPQVIELTCVAADDRGRSAARKIAVRVATPELRGYQPRPVPLPGPAQERPEARPAATPPPPPPPPPAPVPAPIAGGGGGGGVHVTVRPPEAVAPVKAVAPTPAASAGSEYALGNELEAWKNGLKNGGIEYRVPPAMVAQETSTVTVVIHGYQDTQTQTMPDATGTGTLKVSSRMKVELLAPLSPGEFKIVSQGNDLIQFVPNDSFATWIWDVTPTNKGVNQQLQIRVSLVYQSKDGNLEEVLEEKTYKVDVNVEKLAVTVEQGFWKDPLAWFKYMLPGGAGWGALAALVASVGGATWWRRKKKASDGAKGGAKKGDG